MRHFDALAPWIPALIGLVASGCAGADGAATPADDATMVVAPDATAPVDTEPTEDATVPLDDSAAPEDTAVDPADVALGPESRAHEDHLYDPLVFHLDLAILAYQTYTQSLVWPFDPYYEEVGRDTDRDRLMDAIRGWAAREGALQVATGAGLEAFRGPGVLGGFADNPSHDPVVYQYSRIDPWGHAIADPDGRWVEYLTPAAVTSSIREAFVCTRSLGLPEGSVTLAALPDRGADTPAGADDILLVIEGGTGDKGNADQPASWSVMGVVLVRFFGPPGSYDVHIAFRGSRSGSLIETAVGALSGDNPKGNADWITDLGYDQVSPSVITTIGTVSRGMARSLASILPELFYCLDQAPGIPRATPPQHIYITGHSLGGGLAQHLASAILLGQAYGPGGAGAQMPMSLWGWPWAELKLITFGSPRVGDEAWAAALSSALDSPYFASTGYDLGQAIGPTDHEIDTRLLDTDGPAAFRVLLPNDPVSSPQLFLGAHVGRTVYVEPPDFTASPDPAAHELVRVRDVLVDALREPSIPPEAWRYRALTELVPDRDAAAAGTPTEYDKIIAAVRAFHATGGSRLDLEAYDASAATFLELLGGP